MNSRVEGWLQDLTDRFDMNDNSYFKEYTTRLCELIAIECLDIVNREGCGEGGSIRAEVAIKEYFGIRT